MYTLRQLKNYAHLILAITANVVHKFPSKNLVVIGVTGTDGKTTTANLIYHILRKSGLKAAVITTIGAVIDGEKYDTGFHVTTPSPFAIQKYVDLARKKGCTHLVLEVTSHALDQNRVWGIKFDVGVLTNITHEHLDYHKNYDDYVKAKLRLFKNSKISVINSNGIWFERVLATIPKKKIISYSLHGENKNDLTLINFPFQIKTKLIGDFNLENIIAASASAIQLGIKPEVVDEAIQSFDAPEGRQQILHSGKGPVVMVDFAHTANSFANILPVVRKRTKGKLIHVFGAAGERDSGKRPEMGKVASFYDDIIVLTAEDPRGEKISEINSDICKGISNDKEVYEIADRKKAIEFALTKADVLDTVILTGKGHEKSINYGNGEETWSDQDAVKTFYEKKSEVSS